MTSSADLAIRARRAAFNRALADADLSAIGPILANNVIMVTGTDSGVIAGRKPQLMAWKREFSVKDRCVYTRTPHDILVSAIEPIAMETGRWAGVSLSGKAEASGTYCAKWRALDGDWLIEAEIYLTLA